MEDLHRELNSSIGKLPLNSFSKGKEQEFLKKLHRLPAFFKSFTCEDDLSRKSQLELFWLNIIDCEFLALLLIAATRLKFKSEEMRLELCLALAESFDSLQEKEYKMDF